MAVNPSSHKVASVSIKGNHYNPLSGFLYDDKITYHSDGSESLRKTRIANLNHQMPFISPIHSLSPLTSPLSSSPFSALYNPGNSLFGNRGCGGFNGYNGYNGLPYGNGGLYENKPQPVVVTIPTSITSKPSVDSDINEKLKKMEEKMEEKIEKIEKKAKKREKLLRETLEESERKRLLQANYLQYLNEAKKMKPMSPEARKQFNKCRYDSD
jgi:hypothetical protein